MSVQENKAIARRLVEEGWANPEIMDEIVDAGFIFHHDPEGKEAYKRAWTGWFAGLPDARMTVEDIIAEGDKVVVRWACSGTQTGTLWGIPPTGKSVSIIGTFTFRFAGGKIVEQWRNWDHLGLNRQLGLIPSKKETGMIVERHTNTAKPGCEGELVKLLKSWVELGGITARVYTPTYGNDDTVVFYLDFETEQDQQEFWIRLTSAKEHGENWEKWNELRVPGTHIRELYKLL